jgi:hypothetical protein
MDAEYPMSNNWKVTHTGSGESDWKIDEVKASQTATSGGRKFDGGKLQYGLLPPLALKATVDVFKKLLRKKT